LVLNRVHVAVAALAVSVAGAGSALVGTPAVAAPSQELRVNASDDAYTSSRRRELNVGLADKLVTGRLGRDTKISYLKFAVSAPAAGTALTGARLRLVAMGDIAGALSLTRVSDKGWSEKTLTAATAPALGSQTRTGAAKAAATGTEVTFDLGTIVTGPGVYAFALRSSATDAVTRFRSAEAGFGGPELILTTAAASIKPVPTKPVPTKPVPTKPVPTKPVPTKPVPTKPVPTKPIPTTPVPTTPAATPVPAGNECVTGELLVPTCGVLWGAAAGGFSNDPRDEALKAWENTSGRTAAIFHQYHKGDEVFPTKAEIAMTRDPAKPRVLLLNWKIAYGSTWAKVAAGQQDARIDKFAARIKATYNEKFFLALNHEPENDVITNPSAGMQAKDFAAMYRHVILRLRAQGVDNAINVLAYMGNEKWMSQSWWQDLYPGDDVVDWMGLDSYVSAEKGAYHYGMFSNLLDRKGNTGPGWYDWAVSTHPTKPIMVAEWGVYHRVASTVDKSPGYNSVLPELAKRPAIKAMVYFDCLADNEGDRNISIASTKAGLESFRKLAANPLFNVTIR
jgi:beta-mannanase